MTIHKINSSDFENDYSLIAIHSNVEAYKLAYEINLKLKTNLEKSPFNITFKGNDSVFELFKHGIRCGTWLVTTMNQDIQ